MNKKSLLLVLIFLLIGFAIIFLNNQRSGDIVDNQGDTIKLYFATKDAMYLESEERKLDSSGDARYLQAVNKLIEGPESKNLSATIPEGTAILDIKVEGGTALLNFNRALVDNHWGGSTGEIMTVYSIVNTITQFPGIERAQILIDGEEVETLAGHMDLTIPLEPDKTIIKNE